MVTGVTGTSSATGFCNDVTHVPYLTCFVRCFGARLQPLAEVGLGLFRSGRQQVQQRGQPGFSAGLRLVLDFLKLRPEPDQP